MIALEEMALFFENRLDGYDQHMLSDIVGADEFYRFTAELLPQDNCPEIIDLGCGTGLELEQYFALNPSARVKGIDLSEKMLSALKSKFPGKALDLVHGSYFELPFGTEQFDAAVSVESLHHFTPEQKLLLYKKLFRSLKHGGYFILTDYFAESDKSEQEYFENLRLLKLKQGLADDKFYHYDTPLTQEHEIQVLKSAGFTECEIIKSWEATSTIRAVKV